MWNSERVFIYSLSCLQSPEVLHISMHHMLNVLYHIATIHSEQKMHKSTCALYSVFKSHAILKLQLQKNWLFFCIPRKKHNLWVCNDKRMSTYCHNDCFYMQYSFPVTSTVNKCHVEHHSQVITANNRVYVTCLTRPHAWIMNYDQCVSVWLIQPRAIRPDVSEVYWYFQIEREQWEAYFWFTGY